MDEGYIRLWRKINDNIFLAKDNNAYIVFTKLLTYVDWRTGSMTAGRFQLAERVNLKPTTLYKILKRLENQDLVTLTSNNKYTVIGICNWGNYQGDGNMSKDNAVTTRGQRGNTKQELIIKNKEVVTNVTMSTSQPTVERKVTYNDLFHQLVKNLGYSDRTIPTKERLTKLKQRMTTYSPTDLLKAATSLGGDKRMQGDNDDGKRWGNIDYFLRNDTNVAKYLESDELNQTSDLTEVLNNVKW